MHIFMHEIGHSFFLIKEQINNRKAKHTTEEVIWLLKELDKNDYDDKTVKDTIETLVELSVENEKGFIEVNHDAVKDLLTDKSFKDNKNENSSKIRKNIEILTTIGLEVLKLPVKVIRNTALTFLFPLLVTSKSYEEMSKEMSYSQRYNAEKFSDNFAASFGYGKELVDFETKTFSKRNYKDEITGSIPILRVNSYYSRVLEKFTYEMMNPHPSSYKRAMFTLNKLKHELEVNKDYLDPRQIDEIERDIADIEKLLKRAPLFKKAIDKFFSKADDRRDKAGSLDITDQDIYDFDKTILKDRVKNEGGRSYLILKDSEIMLQETYYGKDQILLDCEDCIKAIKESIINGKNPNKCKEKSTFESLIARKFNFEKVYLSILADESGLNAYTMPYFYEKNRNYEDSFFELVSNGSGIRFKVATGKVLYVYTNTYTIRNYSIEEIMGILLHEIGHNFFLIKEQIQNRRAKLFTEVLLYLLKILDQYNYNPKLVKEVIKIVVKESLDFKKGLQVSEYEAVKKFLTDSAFDIVNNKYERDQKGFTGMVYKFTTVMTTLFYFPLMTVCTVFNVMLTPFLITASSYQQLTDVSKKKQNYNAEKFSDNFAASFGYGKGVATTFTNTSRFTYTKNIQSKIPIMNIMFYYNDILVYFTNYMSDPHPTHKRRVVFTLEKLKHELNENRKDLDPRQIQELEQDIADIEQLLHKAPLYRKAIDLLFAKKDEKRDKAGTVGMTDQDIYDFDKTILKDKVTKKEEFDMSDYIARNYEAILENFFETPVSQLYEEWKEQYNAY